MFSLDYIFSKFVFLDLQFVQGFLWMRIFIFLFAMLLLLSPKNRKEIFEIIDAERFAPASLAKEQMPAVLQMAREIVEGLEKVKL